LLNTGKINYGCNIYIQRRMKTEEGREITERVIFVQIHKLKRVARIYYYTSRRYIWNKM
jgi:hypothetical protein